jgi:transglutaminase superfamily protein
MRPLHMRLRTIEAGLFLLAARLFGLRQLHCRFPAKPGNAIAIAKAMQSAARHLPIQTTCLDRSRALYSMLLAHGCPAELRIGAHREDGTLTAHAWVEHEGVPLLDDEAERFTVLSSAHAARD